MFKPSLRRGQTILLALAILFLLSILGGTFVTLLIRNLQRVTRQGETDDALTLALAGLQYASQQFKSSPRGADWRPEPTEVLWRNPNPPAGLAIPLTTADTTPPRYDLNSDGTLDGGELRRLDPDFDWLSDSGNYIRPFVRIATGRGRFLLRVTYVPTFRPATAASEAANQYDEFDANSGMIHIESIGRPGEFDPNDPTSFTLDATNAGAGKGLFRKVEAFVPVGLVDQLWWITNWTNERGPAKMGVPPFRNPAFDSTQPAGPDNQQQLEYSSVFEGAIRSDVDLQFQGRSVIRVYPARNEGLNVAGKISLAPSLTTSSQQVRVDVLDDDGGTDNEPGPAEPAPNPPRLIPPDGQNTAYSDDSRITWRYLKDSGNPAFDPIALFSQGGNNRYVVRDEGHNRQDPISSVRSTRHTVIPKLDQVDATTGVTRLRQITRDSGGQVTVTVNGSSRTVNAGWYGITDAAVNAVVRARGLYLANFDDIQWRNDRKRVKDEWLQRDPNKFGWYFNRYTPSVRLANTGNPRDIAEVILTEADFPDPANPSNTIRKPAIRVFRNDPDTAQYNWPAGPPTDPARFYDLSNINVNGTTGAATADLVNPTLYRDFEYPENGVLFAEGSIRIRGIIGSANTAKQLTIVSGGTIYIEGNLIKARPDSFLGLLAQDYVTLNPSAFQRVGFNGGVPSSGDHVIVDQNEFLDFTLMDAGDPYNAFAPITSAVLHLKHGAQAESNASETAVHLFLPRLNTATNQAGWPDWGVDKFNFGGAVPPAPTPPNYSAAGQAFYLFHQISPGAPTVSYAESNYQSTDPTSPIFEKKSFLMSQLSSDGGTLTPGGEARFRLMVQQKDNDNLAPNQQPYLLSRIAMVPENRPLAIRVEAVIYAYTGSWFIIPPPFFNTDTDDNGNPDSRARFANSNANQNLRTRVDRTFPLNTGHYPFWNEALNMDIRLIGAISENFPAEPAEAAEWTKKMWVYDPAFDHSAFPPAQPPAFSPNLFYRYDPNLRRMVRVRILKTGQEVVAWTLPTGAPAGVPTLNTVIANALAVDSYVETLPVLPQLPASAVIYEGNPIQ